MSLTEQEINEAQNRLTTQGTSAFYSYLESKGEDYGRLGAGVTENNSWQGELANLYAQNAGEDNGKDLTPGSNDWNDLNEKLAQRHLDAYRANNGGSPTDKQIKEYHNDEYRDAGLDADDWFPNKMLEESTNPEETWNDWMKNENPADIWEDAIDIAQSGGDLLFGPYLFTKAMLDPNSISQADMDFAKNLLRALMDLSPEARESLGRDLLGDSYDLPGDYGWMLDKIGDLLNGFLPDGIESPTQQFSEGPKSLSPLILDIDGDGIEVTKLGVGGDGSSKVYFDLTNDGFAERTAWVTGGDGLLAWDRNGNGKIDNQSELFGNGALDGTHSAWGQVSNNVTDGFAALRELDSNHDNKITSADQNFSKLRVWIDADGDGVTDAGELKTLAGLKITSIDLNATDLMKNRVSGGTFINDNLISATSTFIRNGKSQTISDVWFTTDLRDTVYTGNVNLKVETLFLPTLKGYGTLKDLHVAMSENNALLTLVKSFALGWNTSKFATPALIDENVKTILFTWAGVENVSSTKFNSIYDYREVAFLEKITGTKYTDDFYYGLRSHMYGISEPFHQAFNTLLRTLKSQLILQAGGDDFFVTSPSYDLAAGQMTEGVISQQSISSLSAQAKSSSNAAQYWKSVLTLLFETKIPEEFTSQEKQWIEAAMKASSTSLSWNATVADIRDDFPGLLIRGDRSTMSDTRSPDMKLVGTDMNDTFIAAYGDTIFVPKAGNDTLQLSSHHNNKIIYQSGHKYIQDNYGNGEIFIDRSGFKASDATFKLSKIVQNGYVSYVDLHIYLKGQHVFTIENHYRVDAALEKISFRDGSFIDLTRFKSVEGAYGYFDEALSGLDDVLLKDDYIKGWQGNDTLRGNGGNDLLMGEAGNDTLYGGIGNDELYGGAEDDILFGEAGNDIIYGESGSDVIDGGSGDDFLSGENIEGYITYGVDTVTYSSALSAVTVNLALTTAQNTYGAGIDTLMHFANLIGSAYNDTLTGNTGANRIDGGSGNDTIDGGAGNDVLIGGAGTDTLSYASATAAVTVNLALTTAQNTVGAGTDTISLFENLTGSAYNDTLTGNTGANRIDGGNGNDTIDGGAGNDVLIGGAGTDTLSYASATAAVTVNLATTTVQTTGGSGSDTISLFENLTGSGYNDTLRGTTGVNVLNGGNGNDIIYGNSGNDTIYGGAGNDTLYGDAGNDILYGDAGTDTLYGGAGADTFKFQSGGGIDTIKDFKLSELDKLDIRDLLSGYTSSKAITDFIQITTSGTNSIVKIDANGTTGGVAWTQIATIEGVTGLTDELALKNSGVIVV